MSEPCYHLSPLAQKELDEKKELLARSFKFGLISKDQLIEEFNTLAARLYAVARVEVNGEEMVTAYCDCGREHRMKADVMYFRCICTPHEERTTGEFRTKGGLLTNRLIKQADAAAQKQMHQGEK